MTQHSYSNQAARPIDAPIDQPDSNEYLEFIQDRQQEAATSHFVAADEKMLRVQEIINQIKDTNVPVLVTGESGTGKEVIARAIHARSARAEKPFVAVNCAALPSNLLESELFGYEQGAFTGATHTHQGKFEQANGGTLLLDEVTEMAPALQAKLLRALQEKEIERLGGTGPIPITTRIIATTNRDITKAVAQGQFRQDLYYRLHVIQIDVPPLRERPKDVEALSTHFLQKYAAQFGKPNLMFSGDALNKLKAHPWPGNVRELQNVVQRAVLMAGGSAVASEGIPVDEAPVAPEREWISHLPIGRPLKELETYFILETLKSHNGNRTHAAKTLGISLRTLRNKINEYTAEGLDVMAPANGRLA